MPTTNIPIKKGGILYPSIEWYNKNVLAKSKEAVGGREIKKVEEIKKTSEIPEAPQVTPELVISDPKTQIPDVSEAKSRLELSKTASELAQKRADELAEERKLAIEKGKTAVDEISESLVDRPTIEEKRKEEFKEIGVSPTEYFDKKTANIAEIGKLLEDYDAVVAQKDAAILLERERPGLQPTIDKRVAKEEREWNSRLASKSAVIKTKLAIMEMAEGNFNEARSFVNQAVADYTFDLKLELKQYEDFKDENSIILKDLDKKYRDALDDVYNAKYKELELIEKEKTNVLNLMLDNPIAGIIVDDTIEEATKKASKAAGEVELRKRGLEERELSLAERREIRLGSAEAEGRIYLDDEIKAHIRQDIRDAKAEGVELDYQTIADAIVTNPDIINKDKALLIAREMFGLPSQISEGITQKETEILPNYFQRKGLLGGITKEGSFVPFPVDVSEQDEDYWVNLFKSR